MNDLDPRESAAERARRPGGGRGGLASRSRDRDPRRSGMDGIVPDDGTKRRRKRKKKTKENRRVGERNRMGPDETKNRIPSSLWEESGDCKQSEAKQTERGTPLEESLLPPPACQTQFLPSNSPLLLATRCALHQTLYSASSSSCNRFFWEEPHCRV